MSPAERMVATWSDGVGEEFYGRTAGGEKTALLALFHNCGGSEGEVRYDYMDIITRKYQENFSCQLGDWCAAHGVEYIGHVLEDNGLHSRLGPGPATISGRCGGSIWRGSTSS